MRQAGKGPKPTGHATHHIVPRGTYGNRSPARANLDRAQAKLQQLGVKADEAANGVYLPTAFHNKVHTDDYFTRLASALRGARTRKDAERTLQDLAQSLDDQARRELRRRGSP
jgi:hypothetical protein